MKRISIIISLLFISFTTFSQIAQKAEVDKIFSEWDTDKTPGAALGIVKDGKLIYSNGYGLADMEHDVDITPETVFYIGSVSKQFVTICILLLEEQGKLNLDDKIQKYLPDFPDYGSPLTIRHFIHHTSGVRDYLGLMYLKGRSYLDNIDEADVYELIKSQKELNFTPGEKFLYSNSCYFMLAMIVEKAAGEPIREFADNNIFNPLGMTNTLFFDDIRDIIKNKAFSYRPSDNTYGFDNLVMRFDLVGSGGVYSTIEDLYLWDQNFYNNRLGKGGQAIIEKMHEEGLLNNGESSGYAFALINGSYKGLKTVSHGGALAGYRAQLMRFPNQNFSIIVIANRGDANPTGLTYKIADLFLKDQFINENQQDNSGATEKKNQEIAENEFQYNQLTGRYEIEPGVIAEVSIDGDSLHLKQHWDGKEYNILSEGSNTFKLPVEDDLKIKFSDLKDGKTQIIKINQNGNEFEAKRKKDFDRSKIILGDYTGDFYSEELNVIYTITEENNELKIKIPYSPEFSTSITAPDEFTYDGNLVEFKRNNDIVTGFKLNAGRVQNLNFVKQ